MAKVILKDVKVPSDFPEVRQGDIWILDGRLYLLARISAENLCLVSLSDGNRWQSAGPIISIEKSLRAEGTLYARSEDLEIEVRRVK